MINLLCDRSLMVGCEKQTSRISEEHVVAAAAQLGQDIPKGKIKGERATDTATTPRSTRTAALVGGLAILAAVAASIAFLGNPLEWASAGVLPNPSSRPVRALPLTLTALPVNADMPIAPVIPAPAFGSFSILIGTYDNAREVRRVEALLRSQQLTPYEIDILMAPDDLQRRVLLGRYMTREDADVVFKKLGAAFPNARIIAGAQERLRVIAP
jgi:hypothetical protein